MGQQVNCTARFGDRVSAGIAQLETDDLRFRGDFRLKYPYCSIGSLEVDGGTLIVGFPDGIAQFELGPRAARWAESIRHPKTLIDKLDVKGDSRVAVLGIDDAQFLAQLHERVPAALIVQHLPDGDSRFDLLFLGVEQQTDLEHIPQLLPRLDPAGGLWIVAPKGQRHLTEMDVLLAGRAAGLKDIKVARFSATHTAHKFVIPRERR